MSNYKIVIGLIFSMALTGCGATTSEDPSAAATVPEAPVGHQAAPLPEPTVDAGDPLNFAPAISQNFSWAGTGSSTTPPVKIQNIQTDNLLKVKITPQGAGSITVPGMYSNYTANYGCMKFSVRVKHLNATTGYTVSTPNMLLGSSPAQGCAGQDASAVIDLSSQLSPGHGAVTVELFGARYDVYCQYLQMGMMPGVNYSNYNWYYNNYCSTNLYPVYQTHTVNGTIEVQTNGTSFGG